MSSANTETPRRVPGASPRAAEGGASAATVARVRRRREAASRCTPHECGHQDPLDCDAAGCPQPDEVDESVRGLGPADPSAGKPGAAAGEPTEALTPADFADLWAAAKALYLAHDFPLYASPAWRRTSPEDPHRLAAVLDAAEKWRKYGDDYREEYERAFRARPPIADRPTHKELNDAYEAGVQRAQAMWMRERAALELKPSWPPAAIPGQPDAHEGAPEQERRAA